MLSSDGSEDLTGVPMFVALQFPRKSIVELFLAVTSAPRPEGNLDESSSSSRHCTRGPFSRHDERAAVTFGTAAVLRREFFKSSRRPRGNGRPGPSTQFLNGPLVIPMNANNALAFVKIE